MKEQIEAALRDAGLVEQDTRNDAIGYAVEQVGEGYVAWPMSQGDHGDADYAFYLGMMLMALRMAGIVARRRPPPPWVLSGGTPVGSLRIEGGTDA